MDIALIIFLALGFGGFYLWKKEYSTYYFRLMWIDIIFLINHVLSFYIIKKFLSLKAQIVSINFFILFNVLLVLLALWILVKDLIDDNNKKEQWLNFFERLDEQGIKKVSLGAIIERNGKFLLLNVKRSNPDEQFLDLPRSIKEINKDDDPFGALNKGLKQQAGLKLKKFVISLGRTGYINDLGESMVQINYLVKSSSGEVKIDKDVYNNYYWISPDDVEFSKLNIPEGARIILKHAQNYLRKNSQEKKVSREDKSGQPPLI